MADKFVEHLEELYEHYRPETDHLPTADQILSGMLDWPEGLDFDQTYWLINQCGIDLSISLGNYRGANILTDGRAERFFAQVLKWQSVEMQVLAMQAILAHHKIAFKNRDKNIPSLEALAVLLKDYTVR